MFYNNKILLIIFNLILLSIQGQERQEKYSKESYDKIYGLFESYSENDDRAMSFVNRYIDKAKNERNLSKLIEGYEEAIYYNKSIDRKLSYADSTIITAKKYNNPSQISRAYLGKGIIYYYNRRQYRLALDQYLLAFKFSKDSKDDYLKNKIIYHLGMVKCYLGYYKEAAEHFEEAAGYFESHMSENIHPNLKLNNESGYFNSIYRLSTCYKNLHLYRKEDSLITIGLERLQNTSELSIEYGYFQKGKGVQLLKAGKSDEALTHLELSQDILIHNQDCASLNTVYFYLGKLYWQRGNRTKSLHYLNKVDSLVNKFRFITPEIREGYEYLIKDAKQSRNSKKQLYYTNQLLKADSIINADFAMLSSKIYREYDTGTLLAEKKQLEEHHHNGLVLLYISIAIGILLLLLAGFSIWRFRNSKKREHEIDIKYQELLQRVNDSKKNDAFEGASNIPSYGRSTYNQDIIDEVKSHLELFENKKFFLKKNLTLPIVAKMIGSHRTQLSYVLNEHYQMTFNRYLKVLRIQYITNLLLENSKYLNYSIDSLAEECGMTSRQVFSIHFMEINGMRPVDFIRKRKEELEKS